MNTYFIHFLGCSGLGFQIYADCCVFEAGNLSVVNEIHFYKDDKQVASIPDFDLDRILVYDVSCFPNVPKVVFENGEMKL